MKNPSENNTKSYVLLIFFGVATLVVFGLEIGIGANDMQGLVATPLSNVLFGFLEFGLALGFGWILQDIASKEEYRKGLRQYALSAYRRIGDIQKSVERLRTEASRMRFAYAKEKVHELDVLKMIAEEMNDTVNSSISDWMDIIGEDIKKKEKLQELQTEQVRLKAGQGDKKEDPETIQRLDELKGEIGRLRAELPYRLQADIEDTYPREGRPSEIVYRHFAEMVYSQSCIILTVNHMGEISKENLEELINGQPYSLYPEHGMSRMIIDVVDKNNNHVGFVENTFEDAGVYDNDFFYTVMEMLSPLASSGSEGMMPGIKDKALFAGTLEFFTQKFFIKIELAPEMVFRG